MTDLPTTICEFAYPGPLRDALVGAVLSGRKTATTSLLLEWEHDGDPLPTVVWTDELQPDLGIDLVMDDDTPIVVERFRLVERLPAP